MNEPNNNDFGGRLLVHLLPKMGDQSDSEQQPIATAAVPSLNAVQTLRFPPPDVFDGSEDKFDEFEFKMKGFTSLSDVRFRRLMNDAKEATDPINFDKLSSEEQNMAIQLQIVLETLCCGSALEILRREDTDNGFETWRRLCSRYILPKRFRSIQRLTSVLK